tara:strand:+ start:198 stop:965 length:768 start_codon:yes stop_codon:yes gene_type:complete
MDYLNYGKQKQKPQGFGKNVELTSDDFSFGDLNSPQEKLSPPPSPTKNKDELLALFPSPVLICPYPNDFANELEWIRNHETDKENVERKERFNRQSKETFILDKPQLVNIRKFIEEKLLQFSSKILLSDDQLIITQSWLNKNAKGESHHDHFHPNSILSGVWYPQITDDNPPIKFKSEKISSISLRKTGYNNFNGQTYYVPVKQGELIIFSSNLSHSVPHNQSNEERISLSFNTWAKGNIGSIESLTYLPLDRCV